MTRVARLLGERFAAACVGVSLLAWAPIEPPLPRVGLEAAVLAGCAAGCAAFVVLARRVPPLRRPAVAWAAVLVAPVVIVGAVGEEAVWRFGALRGLEPVLGPAGATAVSTLGFAAAHAGRSPVRSLAGHLVTGAAFGCVYLATGRLVAAVVAHVAYNLLVVSACAAWGGPSDDAEAVA